MSRRDPTAARRSKAYRARKREQLLNVAAARSATPSGRSATAGGAPPSSPQPNRVTVLPPIGHPRLTPLQWLASATLAMAALGLAAVGVAVNGWFAHSLGSTEVAARLFLAIGVGADVAGLMLPCAAVRAWRSRHRGAASVAWACWLLTFVFAISAGVGFASVNIADTTLARVGKSTPAIEAAQRALDDAKAARDRECIKVGAICRTREDMVVERQRALDLAMRATDSTADPQTDAATRLV